MCCCQDSWINIWQKKNVGHYSLGIPYRIIIPYKIEKHMIEILYTKLQFCNLCIRWNNLYYTHQKPVFTQLPFNCTVIFWGVLSILFCKRQFCMIFLMHVVILSQNFSQHLWVTVHRLQVYACVEGSQSYFLYCNVLYILILLLYTQTCFLYRMFLKKCTSP